MTLASFARVLNQLLTGFAYGIKQLKEQKDLKE